MKKSETSQRRQRPAGGAPKLAVIGSIPGLERLLPGSHSPGGTVRSSYGTWILPTAFRGRRISSIVDGRLLG
jgi:hypothetical protein